MFVFATVAYLAVLTTSEQPSTCSRSNGMTEELRKVVVDEHNKYRSLVAKGLAPNPVAGGNAPKAARMFKMYYDCSVEDKMVAWVQQCTWGHSPKTDRKGLGENLWMASPYGGNKTASIIRAVTDWFAELKEKGVPNTNQFTSAVFSRGVGHYTQVVWEKSDRIGCAIRDCPSAQMTYVGCEYKPGGNMLNDYIYEIGDPCTRNEHCKCDNCTCSTEEGLCIRPDSTPMPGDVNSQTQGKPNWFTGFMDSKNQQQNDLFSSMGFGPMNLQNQQWKDGFFSSNQNFKDGFFSSNQNLKDGFFSSMPMSFSWKSSNSKENQKHENDWFPSSFSSNFGRLGSKIQGENHKWTSEPHGNGFKWSYSNSWSS
ncbi:hypothetical protein GCK32_014718 [Trichostrongylus colubriformis]|uniref:SCP domain-containing protein n=1 Tax=Trichostrongylus colubriformis TaxID=6319 RepID=A0AAN8FLC0_TRICO